MKTHLRYASTLIQLACLLFLGSSCASSKTPANRYEANADSRPRVDAKYSLTADRAALDEIRAQEPAEKKKDNDESSFMLNLFGVGGKDLQPIGENLNSVVIKKAEL